MKTNKPPVYQVITAFASVYLIWGSTYLAIRYAIETMPPFLMAGIRFLIAGGLLYAFARFKGEQPMRAAHWKGAFIVGGLMLLGGNGGVVWAEQFVPSGLTALLISTTPIWMVLINSVMPGGERPGKWVVAGVVLGFGGLFLLINPAEAVSGKGVHPGGMVALLAATFSWSLGSILNRKVVLPPGKFVSIAVQMAAGGICLLVAALFNGDWQSVNTASISSRSLLAFGYLIVFGSLLGYTAYIWLLGAVGTSRAATYAYVNPVVAVFLGWLLAGEPLTGGMALSAVVIIASVVIINTVSGTK